MSKDIHEPKVDFQSSGSLPQSAFENAMRDKDLSGEAGCDRSPK